MGELFLQLVCPVCHTVAWTRERGPLTTDEVNQDKTDSIVGLYQGLVWEDCKRFGEVFLEGVSCAFCLIWFDIFVLLGLLIVLLL